MAEVNYTKARHLPLAYDRIRFDFDQHVRIDQAFDLDHRRSWPDIPENIAMRPADLLPLIDVRHVDSGPDDIRERGAGFFQRVLDGLERLNRLFIGIALADQPGWRHRRCTGNLYR